MTIQLKYYTEGDTFHGIFDEQMDGERIEASSSKELNEIAENKCIERYGEYAMKRATLQINQINPPTTD